MALKPIRIGELARRSHCSVETIRYYERVGLLPRPQRIGRYRHYDEAGVACLLFVRRARELGFTLDEIRALLRSTDRGAAACAEAREVASAHLSELRKRIADLRAMERVLSSAVKQCAAAAQPSCPLIETLSSPASL